MYTLELGVFMFKSSINHLPVVLKDYFTKRSDTHNYPTRYVNDFNLTNNKKAFSVHSSQTLGPVHWNSLSKSMRDSKSVKHFRKQLKQKLMNIFLSPSLSCRQF